MGKGLLFFCCACCILVLTIVNLSIGPSIKYGALWGTLNCALLKDNYDQAKDLAKELGGEITDKEKKYNYKWKIDECDRKKGMHDMEYTAFIFDIVIGFVCGLIGLLHLFDLKKDFVVNTGLIGLVCGAVGFILTFVYVIFNGLVYTNYYYLYDSHDDTAMLKIDGDGAFAELDGNRYKCFYFDKDAANIHSYYAKFSDWGKKQYNYNKGLAEDFEKIDTHCKQYSPSVCVGKEYVEGVVKDTNGNDCKLLYTSENDFDDLEITNKDISDRFLTALILSLFVCLANIGLALFGFLLFRSPDSF